MTKAVNMEEAIREYYTQSEKWHSDIYTSISVKHPDIIIKTVKNFNSIFNLNDQWNDVVLNSSSATIYQTFEWLYNWWNYFAASKSNSPHILLISSSGKLIGIAPFYIQSYTFGGFIIHRQLKLIGCGLKSGTFLSNAIEENGVSDYLDIIALNNYEKKVADAVVSYLSEYKNLFNEIDFQNVSEGSFIFKWLLPQLQIKNFRAQITKTDACPRLTVPRSIDIYLGSLKASTRRKFRQIQRQTEKYSDIEIIKVCDTNFLNSIQTLKHLHQSRWNELGHLGLFADKRFEEFIIHVCKIFFNKGWLWFKEAKFNNKIIATRMAYQFKDRIYDYLSGFDHKHFPAFFRPGMALIFTMIDDAISHNYGTVDFLRGTEEYKYEFSSDEHNNYDLIIIQPDSVFVIRKVFFYFLKTRMRLMFRVKTETAIIKLQIGKHGKIMFLFSYFRFCLSRLRVSSTKNKRIYFKEEKIQELQSNIILQKQATRKNKNSRQQRIVESVVDSLQHARSEDELPTVKNKL